MQRRPAVGRHNGLQFIVRHVTPLRLLVCHGDRDYTSRVGISAGVKVKSEVGTFLLRTESGDSFLAHRSLQKTFIFGKQRTGYYQPAGRYGWVILKTGPLISGEILDNGPVGGVVHETRDRPQVPNMDLVENSDPPRDRPISRPPQGRRNILRDQSGAARKRPKLLSVPRYLFLLCRPSVLPSRRSRMKP